MKRETKATRPRVCPRCGRRHVCVNAKPTEQHSCIRCGFDWFEKKLRAARPKRRKTK